MIIKTLKVLLLALALMSSCAADEQNFSNRFFYQGGIVGNADVDWSSVVSTDIATVPFNPLSADGNGVLFGLDTGYQFSPHFAVEAELINLPTSKLVFNKLTDHVPLNAYNAENTNANMLFAAIMFKVIAPFPNSKFSLFADAGPAYQYLHYQNNSANDLTSTLHDIGTWAPTFGGGLLYRINGSWQAEASFQYAPGTGKSVGDPMHYYIPEIYAGTFKLDYIF